MLKPVNNCCSHYSDIIFYTAFDNPSTLTKIRRIILLFLFASGLSIGLAAYFAIGNINLMYGMYALAGISLIGLALTYLNISRKRLSKEESEAILELHWDNEFISEAFQKISGCYYKKVLIFEDAGGNGCPLLYFGGGDCRFNAFNYNEYAPGEVLLITLAIAQDAHIESQGQGYVEEMGRGLPEFKGYGHHHIKMSYKEYQHLQLNRSFPWNIRRILENGMS